MTAPARRRTVAAVVRAAGAALEICELEIDQPGPGEVLVRVSAVGLCHTDLLVADQVFGPGAPAVPGHEGVGRVAVVGPGVTDVAPGDRVLITFASCGRCRRCLRGAPSTCERYARLNFAGERADGSTTLHDLDGTPVRGSFFGQSSLATLALTGVANLVPLPEDVPDAVAAPLACGVQTGVGAVLTSLAARPGDSLVVMGAGAVGLSAVLAARVAGVHPVIAVDVLPGRLDLARELGADHTVDARPGPVADRVRELCPGGVDHALDLTGRMDAVRDALACLAPGGTLGLVGSSADPRAEVRLDHATLFGRRVIGISQGDAVPRRSIPFLLDLHRRGLLPVEGLVRAYPFHQVNQAVADSRAGRAVKAVLLMPDEPG